MRFVLGLPPRGHVGQDELNKIKFLHVKDRITQLCLNHIFKVRAGTSPYYFNDMLTEVSNVHKFNTRQSSHNYIVPSVKGIAANTFFSQVTKLWNNLPKEIKGISSYMSFKRKVKLQLSLSERASAKQDCDFIF